MRSLSRILLALSLLVLSTPLSAAATAGRGFILLSRGAWVPIDGGAVTALGLDASEVQSAFDGEHFLVVWRSASEVRAELLAAGAVDPLSVITLSTTATRDPLVVWDGTRYLVFWTDTLARGAVVSAQGVVERSLSFVLPSVDAVTAGPNGVVLLSLYGTESATYFDASILGDDLRVRTTTRISTIPTRGGSGATYLIRPRIAPFGPGWYVTWLIGYGGQVWELLGTRFTADGATPDREPFPIGGATGAGRFLMPSFPFSPPSDLEVVPFSDRAAVLARINDSLYASLIDATGAPTLVVQPPNHIDYADTALLPDGTVVGITVASDMLTAVVSPLLRTAPYIPRRRTARH